MISSFLLLVFISESFQYIHSESARRQQGLTGYCFKYIDIQILTLKINFSADPNFTLTVLPIFPYPAWFSCPLSCPTVRPFLYLAYLPSFLTSVFPFLHLNQVTSLFKKFNFYIILVPCAFLLQSRLSFTTFWLCMSFQFITPFCHCRYFARQSLASGVFLCVCAQDGQSCQVLIVGCFVLTSQQ